MISLFLKCYFLGCLIFGLMWLLVAFAYLWTLGCFGICFRVYCFLVGFLGCWICSFLIAWLRALGGFWLVVLSILFWACMLVLFWGWVWFCACFYYCGVCLFWGCFVCLLLYFWVFGLRGLLFPGCLCGCFLLELAFDYLLSFVLLICCVWGLFCWVWFLWVFWVGWLTFYFRFGLFRPLVWCCLHLLFLASCWLVAFDVVLRAWIVCSGCYVVVIWICWFWLMFCVNLGIVA